jgi:hypothetical protein
MPKYSALLSIAMFLIALCNRSPARAESCTFIRSIKFDPGASGAVVRGAVARGEVECLGLAAKAGQEARIAISSVEKNAVFQFYQPGWKIARDAGDVTVNGKPYAGAGEADDAMKWSGRLAGSGVQLLVVGSTRGGATYELRLTIRP